MKTTVKILFLLLYFSISSMDCQNNPDFHIKNELLLKSNVKYVQYYASPKNIFEFNTILVRKVEETTHKGSTSFSIVQKYYNAKGIDVDSTVVDRKTLKPLAYYTNLSSENYKEYVLFTKDSIRNSIIFEDSIRQKVIKNKNLFNGVIQDELIAALHPEVGQTYRLSLINAGVNLWEYQQDIKVLKKEILSVNNLKIPCLKVNISYVGIDPKYSSTAWYSLKNYLLIRSEGKVGNKKFIKSLII